jgi:hypothetical protein
MTLNFIHPHGESGETPPNLGFTRGESIEERRKALNEAKQRVRMLTEAARTGNVWYVIAIGREGAAGGEVKRSAAGDQPDDGRLAAAAAVFADIENRCVTVHEFRSVPLEGLNEELRVLLGQAGPASPPERSAAVPPS